MDNFFIRDFVKGLENRVRFSPIGGPDGDACCKYDVLVPKGTKVSDIISFALSQDEWGLISVKKGNTTYSLSYKRGTIDNRTGSIVSDNIPDEIKRMIIKSITSYGGWSKMDYELTV